MLVERGDGLYWKEGGKAGPGIQQALLQLREIVKGKAPEGFTKHLAGSESQKQPKARSQKSAYQVHFGRYQRRKT